MARRRPKAEDPFSLRPRRTPSGNDAREVAEVHEQRAERCRKDGLTLMAGWHRRMAEAYRAKAD